MSVSVKEEQDVIDSDVPARLDRLPWSRWHWLVIASLGITWIIDGLEVTLVGAFSGVLQDQRSLHFSASEMGLLGTAYLVGAVIGAIGFGYLTDRFGRKKLFQVTLGLYLVSALLTAFSWNFASFAFFRFLTGAAIGGEYGAINSAIDELIPSRVRGWTDLAINGTFWLGAAVGSVASMVLLNPAYFSINLGWRLGFGIGAVAGLVVIFMRNGIPESPRWLLVHGQHEEAERIVGEIESEVKRATGGKALPRASGTIRIEARDRAGFADLITVMVRTYPTRTVLGLSLVISQAFLYNGIYFTFPLVLRQYYRVASDETGAYLLPFALSNFLGPLLLGRFFDTVGRRVMIAGTYTITSMLLILSGILFVEDQLTAVTQTLVWTLLFFFASAAASSAYLTVSEIFPVELRGMVIALFFAVGTLIGGTLAPWLFGTLIETGSRAALFGGDMLAVFLLAATVAVVWRWGVDAERSALETVARPLSAAAE